MESDNEMKKMLQTWLVLTFSEIFNPYEYVSAASFRK